MHVASTVLSVIRCSLAIWLLTGTLAFSDDEVQAEVAEEAKAEDAKADGEGAEAEEGDAGAKPDEAEAKADEKEANPLGRLFRNLLVPKQPERPLIPKVDKPEVVEVDERDRPRDDIDMRAPQNPAQTQRLRRAADLVEGKRWEEALRTLEFVLDPKSEDSLVRSEDGRWISIRDEANRLLRGLPDEFMETYRLNHGPEAARQLDEALAKHDISAVVGVASQFFHTEAGQKAASSLVSFHTERGQAGLAARWCRRLLEIEAPVTRSNGWKLRAAAVFERAGDADRAQELLAVVRESGLDAEASIAGDERVALDDWLKRAARTDRASAPLLHEWWTVMGSARRTGIPAGSEPLLIERWGGLDFAHAPQSTGIERIREQIDTLVSDLRDFGLPTVPAATPIAVNNVIAFRTLSGVRVVDADTGRTRWQTQIGVSPEMLLGGAPLPGATSTQNFIGPYYGGNADNHPLTHLLFRDDLWGTISSDGDRLYVVEGDLMRTQQHMYSRRNGAAPMLSNGRKLEYETNRIAAYSLATGRPIWQIGGPDHGEAIQPPLAGYHFLGVPVASENDLLVVGEKNSEVRLVAIDPVTGTENWSQLVALSDSELAKDFYRRLFGVQVAVGDGVIVCPTTVGWLVGVDARSHQVLWAQRYTKPRDKRPTPSRPGFRGGVNEVTQTNHAALGDRWLSTPPVIVGGRVVFAPPEHGSLLCYDLFSGRKLWERPKDNGLYVAGVVDERVLIVGRRDVTALDLGTGTVQWQATISEPRTAPAKPNSPAGSLDEVQQVRVRNGVVIRTSGFRGVSKASYAGNPASTSGRAVVLAGHLYVPTANGELVGISLNDGEIVSRKFLPDSAEPLGNLVAYRDGVHSLTALGLRSFEQRDVVEGRIAAARENDPGNPVALLTEAEIEFQQRRYRKGLALLDRIDQSRATDDVGVRLRRARQRALTALVVAEPQNSAAEIDRLAELAENDADSRRVARARATRLQAIGDFAGAFAVLHELATVDVESLDELIARNDDANVRVRFASWLGGRLSDTWNRLSAEDREKFDASIAEAAAGFDLESGDEAIEDAWRFCRLYRFHTSAIALEERLVEATADSVPLAVTEMRLRRLVHREDPAVAAGALYRLGRLFLDAELPADAAVEFDRLVKLFPGAVVEGDRTAKEIVTALRESGALSVSKSAEAEAGWGDVDVHMIRTREYSAGQQFVDVPLGDPDTPFLRDHRFGVQLQQNHFGGGQVRRLVVADATGDTHWMPSLRTRSDSGNNNVAGKATGHLLCLLSNDGINVLSPVDRRVVWSRVTSGPQRLASFYRNVSQPSRTRMQNGSSIVASAGLSAMSNRGGLLAAANGDYVCMYDRRKIVVRDVETGRMRWELGGLPRQMWVAGNEHVLFVVTQTDGRIRCFRPSDGAPLDLDGRESLVNQALRIDENGLVVVETRSSGGLLGLGGTRTIVRRVDPLTGKDDWKTDFDRNIGLAPAGRLLVAVAPDGNVTSLDLQSGERRDLGVLPEEVLKSRSETYAFTDHDHVFLAVNQRNRNSYSYYSESIPSLRVNGWMVALDRGGKGLRWKQQVGNQNLLLPNFEHTPWIVYASRRYERIKNQGMWKSSTLVLDKATGRRLYDDFTSNSNGFQSIRVNHAARYVELNSYNGRMRFQAVPRAEAAGRVDEKPKAEAEPAVGLGGVEEQTEGEAEQPAAEAVGTAVEAVESR